MSEKIMGLDWQQIQDLQHRKNTRPTVNLTKPGDYGADPIGDGTFRMVPSGDIVDYAERCKRLERK